MDKSFSLGTLYEFNKQIVAKEQKMSNTDIEKAKKELELWFNWYLDGYAMLLCRERYDFTIFHLYQKQNLNPPAVAADELIELLKSRGTPISIEKDIDKNIWEIWIKIDDEPFVYYLFDCDPMVIEC